jgi:eukaryotic-like serine/threonine-protein kinase
MTPQALAHYRITAKLGEGGMGEVYRATDTKLKRDVALKLLPEAFARDPDRMARFQREAEVLASLNHPNIAAIYGVEENALVMELAEGESPKGPMPFDDAWRIATQIAEALEYAHEKGVIHRDLKPANVKVTPEGVVKLLDFGLAKAFREVAPASAGDPQAEARATLTMGATEAGVILGTAAYMAPEQARGRSVDKRADIWAFGVLLYELLTGERPFQGDEAAGTLAQVLTREPDLERVQPQVRKLLRRCMEKDPKQRLRDIGDARSLLGEEPSRLSAPLPSRFGWVAAAAAIIIALVFAFLYLRETPPEARVVTATILPPDGAAFDFSTSRYPPAVSPDGRRVVFGARSADGKTLLWVRSLNSRTAQSLAGTENARFPFWSPDSKSIGFFAGGKLKAIDAAGGPALTLADAPVGHGGSWSTEGVIVFAPDEGGPLQRVPAAGGTPSLATTLAGGERRSHRAPWFLPDGRHFLFENWNLGTNDISVQVALLDSAETKTVVRTSSNAIYADGRLLFLRENTLMAQTLDAKQLAAIGDAIPVAQQVGEVVGDAVGLFSAASTGLLAYQAGGGIGDRRLTWFDRSGKPVGTLGDAGSFGAIEFSPDQRSLAASVLDASGNRDLWIYDVARGLRTRFTFDPAIDDDPIWSPDGRSIAFRSDRNKGYFDLYRKSSDGTGAEELLYADHLQKAPGTWSSDGKFLLYAGAGGGGISVLPLTPQQTRAAPQPSLFLQIAFIANQPRFSPDGQWVAYTSNESQQNEIYVAPFPGPGGKRQISTSGGTLPRWRRDGREILYVRPDGRLTAAEVNIKGSTIEVGQVQPLGILVVGPGTGAYSYDLSADGQRFLVVAATEQASAPPLTLIQNWAAGLKK